MGKGSSSPSGSTQTTTVQKADPWSGQQDYLKTLFSQADTLRQTGGPSYYPGQTLATPSPYTTQAIQDLATRAQNGSPVMSAANQSAMDTLNGNYLNSNPYLDQTYNQAANAVTGAMKSAWGGNDAVSGSSGLNQAALGNSLSTLANQIYGQNYQQERGRQAATVALAPQLANQDYTDISQLGTAGDASTALAQQNINDQIQRYNYNQNLPFLNLSNYAQLIQGGYGGSSTTTQSVPYYQSGLGGGLGGALGGAAAGSIFGPFGTAGGAVLGALLGK